MPRQLELLPRRPLTARERREWIRRRLEGFEYRQRGREEKRRSTAARRGGQAAAPPAAPRQISLDDLIARS